MKTFAYKLALLLPVILIMWSCGATDPVDDKNDDNGTPLKGECGVDPTSINYRVCATDSSVDSTFTIIWVGSYQSSMPSITGTVAEVGVSPAFEILSGAGDFELTSPSDTVRVTVRFDPTSTGLKMVDISTGTECDTVSLTGVGVTDTCWVSTWAMDYGDVTVGGQEDRSFFITMFGSPAVPFSGDVTTVGACTDFSITDGGGPFVLNDPSDTVHVTVRFEPTDVGYRWCQITTGSDCGDVLCHGTGQSGGVSDWVECVSGVTGNLNGVGGYSSTNVFVVGDTAKVLEYFDVLQFRVAVGTYQEKDYMDVYAFDADNIWVASRPHMTGGGEILQYTEATWTVNYYDEDLLIDSYNTIWGLSECDIYCLGRSRLSMGNNGLHYNCSELDTLWVGSATGSAVSGVWGSASSDVWAVISLTPFPPITPIWHYDGGSWSNASDAWMDKALYDVWADPGGEAFAVGEDGTIYYYSGIEWVDQSITGMTQDFRGVWASSPNDVFAVGQEAIIYHFNGTIWEQHAVPAGVTSDLNAVWGYSGTHVFAVGNNGTILHYGP